MVEEMRILDFDAVLGRKSMEITLTDYQKQALKSFSERHSTCSMCGSQATDAVPSVLRLCEKVVVIISTCKNCDHIEFFSGKMLGI